MTAPVGFGLTRRDGGAKSSRVYYKKVPFDGGDTMGHTALVCLMDKGCRFVAPLNVKRRPDVVAADPRRCPGGRQLRRRRDERARPCSVFSQR